ncbi:hypothetical protein A2U01_0084841, partial [Trifolium medium]|nr:hypothetical protein [Trifolium medium]
RLKNPGVTDKERSITEEFPDEQLLRVSQRPWFAIMANFKELTLSQENIHGNRRRISSEKPEVTGGMTLTYTRKEETDSSGDA